MIEAAGEQKAFCEDAYQRPTLRAMMVIYLDLPPR